MPPCEQTQGERERWPLSTKNFPNFPFEKHHWCIAEILEEKTIDLSNSVKKTSNKLKIHIITEHTMQNDVDHLQSMVYENSSALESIMEE